MLTLPMLPLKSHRAPGSVALLTLSRFGRRLVADHPTNIWPKLFDHVRNRIVSDLRAPHADSIWQSPIGVRMVTVRGDTRRDRTSENLRVVELFGARIGACDNDPAHRVAQAMQESAVARLVKSGILPQQRWKNGTDHESLAGSIGKSRPVALAITGRTVPVSWLAFLSLADASEKAVPRKYDTFPQARGA